MTRKQKKDSKKVGLIFKVFAILLLLVSLFFVSSLIYLNILNTLLFLLVVVLVLGIDIFILGLIFRGRKKKLGLFLSIIFILIFGVIDFYLSKTTDFLNDLDLSYKTYNYSVVVLKDTSITKLKDINDKTIGYFDDGSSESEKSLNKILGKVEVEPISYEDTHEMANALIEEEVDALLIENSYLEILSESIIHEDVAFKDLVRKIYSFVIVTHTSDISKDINVTESPFHIYVSGIDTYGEISSVSRSDVNMVVTVNPATKQILLTSIPRDYYVQLHGKSGYRDKLTHAGLYGTDMSIQTIEDLLDIEINYYIKVNFTSVIDIVDAIGGVTVYSDYSFTSLDGYQYTKGYNEVNGEEALSFARERKAFATGDRQRVKNQQALLKAIFDKALSKTIITKYTKLLDSVSGSFVTNMKMARMTSLIKMQLSKNYEWNLATNSLTGSDASNYTYSAPSTKAYVMEPDEESVAFATELMQKVMDGEILDEEEVAEGASSANRVTKKESSTSSSSSKEEKKDTTVTDTDEDDEELFQIKLGRSKVEFTEGDEFIYYGYTATYDGEDISNRSSFIESFSIKEKKYDNYQDLVYYISNYLEKGEYMITYTVTYKGETATAIQEVVIKESSLQDEKNTEKDQDSDEDVQKDTEVSIEEEMNSKKESES